MIIETSYILTDNDDNFIDSSCKQSKLMQNVKARARAHTIEIENYDKFMITIHTYYTKHYMLKVYSKLIYSIYTMEYRKIKKHSKNTHF